MRVMPHERAHTGGRLLAWPTHPDWREARTAARKETVGLAAAIGGGKTQVLSLARAAARAADAFAEAEVAASVREAVLGDVWLRDTGPVFAIGPEGPVAVSFVFNGWGGKYVYPGDERVAAQVAALLDLPLTASTLVTEGGAIETDGAGTAILSRDSILNANRNPGLSQSDVEAELLRTLGLERVVWLDVGLLNDHTDGHADTIARFVAPGLVACQAPFGENDPNAEVLDEIARTLDRARDAAGRRLDVVRLPSPGLVLDNEGAPLPASHMNWVFGEGRLVFPTYATQSEDAARAALTEIFPDLEVTPSSASAIITGGGAFHCCSLELPDMEARL